MTSLFLQFEGFRRGLIGKRGGNESSLNRLMGNRCLFHLLFIAPSLCPSLLLGPSAVVLKRARIRKVWVSLEESPRMYPLRHQQLKRCEEIVFLLLHARLEEEAECTLFIVSKQWRAVDCCITEE
jgi:hypothetical protein